MSTGKVPSNIINDETSSLDELYEKANGISEEMGYAVVSMAQEFGIEDQLTVLGGSGGKVDDGPLAYAGTMDMECSAIRIRKRSGRRCKR